MDFEKNKKGEVYKDPVANNKDEVGADVLKRAPVLGVKSVEHHEESAEDRRKRLIEKLNDQFAKEQDYEVEDEYYDVFASQEIVDLAAGSERKVKTLTLKWNNPSVKDINDLKRTFLNSLRSVVSRKDRNPNLCLCVLCGAGLMDKWEEPDGIVVEVQPGRNDMERKYGGNLLIAFKDKEPEVVPEKPEDKEKERVEGRVLYSFKTDENGFFQDGKLISDLKSKVLNSKSFMNMLLQWNATADEREKIHTCFLYESRENPKPLIELSANEMASGKGMVFVVRGKHGIDGKDQRFLIRDYDGKLGRISSIFVLDDGRLIEGQADFLKDLVASDKLVDEDGTFFVSYISLLCDCLKRKLLSGSDIIDILNRYNKVEPRNQVSRVVLEDKDEIPGLSPFDIREAKGITFVTNNEKFKEECEKDGLRIVGTRVEGEWEISVPQKITEEPSDRLEEEEEIGPAIGDGFGRNEYEKKFDLEDLLLKLPETKWYKEQREEYEKGGEKLDGEKRKTYLSNFSVDFDFEQHKAGILCYQLCFLSKEAMKTIRYFIIPALPEDADDTVRRSFVRDLVARGWYFPDGESGLQDALDCKQFKVQYTGGTTRCVLTPYLTGLVYSNEEILKELGEGENTLPRQSQSFIRRPLIFAYAYNNFDENGQGEVDEQYVINRLELESKEVPKSVREKIRNVVVEIDEENVQVLDAVCFYYKQLYTGGQGIGSRNYFLHPWLIDKMFQSSGGLFGGGDQKCDRLVPGTTFIYDVNGENISANKESEAQKNAGIRALDDTFGEPCLFNYHSSPTFDYAMSGDNCWFRIEKPDAKAWFVSFYDPGSNVADKNDRNQEFNKKKKCIAIRWTFKPRYKDGDEEKVTPEAESYQRANRIPALIPQFSEKPVTEEAQKGAEEYMKLFRGWQARDELKRSFAEEKDQHEVSFEALHLIGLGGIMGAVLSEDSKVKSLRIHYSNEEYIDVGSLIYFLHRICEACKERRTAIIEDVNIDVKDAVALFCRTFNSSRVYGDFGILPVKGDVVRFAPYVEWIQWLWELLKEEEEEESGRNDEVIEEEEGKWANAKRLEALLKDSDAYKAYLKDPVNLRQFDFRRIDREIDPELLLKMPDKLLKGFSYFIIPGLLKDADGNLLGIEERKCFVERLILKGWRFNGACMKIAERGGGDKGLDPIFYIPHRPIEEAMNGKMFTVQYTGGTTKCILTPYLTGLCYSKDEIFKALDEKQEDFIKAGEGWRFAWNGVSNISRPLIFAYDAVNDRVRADDLQYISDRMYHGVLPDRVKAEIGNFFGQEEGKISKLSGEELQVLDAVCFYDDKLYANKDKPGTRNYFLHTWLIDKMFRSSIIGSNKCDTIVRGKTFVYTEDGVDISKKGYNDRQKGAGIEIVDDTFGKPYDFNYHSCNNGEYVVYGLSANGCVFAIRKPDAKAWFVSFYDPDDTHVTDRNDEFNRKKKCIAIRWTFKPLNLEDGKTYTPEADSYCMANLISGLLPQFPEKPLHEEARKGAEEYMELFRGWQAMDELKRSFAEEKDQHEVSFEVLRKIRLDGLVDAILSKDSKVKSLRIQYSNDRHRHIPKRDLAGFLHRICEACKERHTAIIKDVNIDTEDVVSFLRAFNVKRAYNDFAVLPVDDDKDVVRFAPYNEWNKWLSDHPLKPEKAEEHHLLRLLIGILEDHLSDDTLFKGFKEKLLKRFSEDGFCFVKEDNGELQWDENAPFVMDETVKEDYFLSGGTRFVEECIPGMEKVCEKEDNEVRCVSLGYKYILYYCINGKIPGEGISAGMLNNAIQGKVENNPGGGDCLVWAIAKGEAKLSGRDYKSVTEAEMSALRKNAKDAFTKGVNKKNNTVEVDGINFPSMYGSAYSAKKKELAELEESGESANSTLTAKQRIEELERDFTVGAIEVRIGDKGKTTFCEDILYFSKVLDRTIFVYAENQGQCTFAFPDGSFFQIGCSFSGLREVFTEDQAKRLLLVRQDLREKPGETHYQTVTEDGCRALFGCFGYRTKDMGEALADLCPDENTTIDLTNFSTTKTVAGKEVERPKGDDDRSMTARILFESDRKQFVLACAYNKNVVRLVLPAYVHVKESLSDVLKELSSRDDVSLEFSFRNNGFFDEKDEVFPSLEEINRLNSMFEAGGSYLLTEAGGDGTVFLRFENGPEKFARMNHEEDHE